ncbi:MAG: thiamine phosphate synthase [Methylocystis sp.]|nr:thiamine phosphate synthase [Methylocystis sp.]MCA3585878.1 thiamine phosphate synthase [Methylocystis sp.]MCA3586612.1 thiamine phosphate synthase [Methylocystis sp.]MCA3590890.1 thiamine phosphate synthase [Methylocystis sp.]
MIPDISLYGIIDPQIARGRSLADLAGIAARSGMTFLQFRAKTMETRRMIAEARAIHDALAGTGVPLLINDRVDVALAAGAEGVHIGRDDMHPLDARRLLGPEAIIGATVKSSDDLASLTSMPISYACIGGVFQTVHKDNADPPLGVVGFRKLRLEAADRLGALPIGAIAGITLENVGGLIAAGADGVAVIGALFGSDDVGAATRAMAAAIAAARSARR